jgi:hypothetical protein
VPNPANPQSWNRFSYVENNPIKFIDPTGHWIDEYDFNDPFFQEQNLIEEDSYFFSPEDAEERFGIKVAMRLSMKTVVKSSPSIVKTPKGTVSIGVGGAGFIGGGLRGEVAVAMDDYCDIALLRSLGGGGYSAAGLNRVGPSISITNAPHVENLEGWSVQFGGQVGETASLGGEGIMFKDRDGNRFGGFTIAGGAALQGPLPGELHASFTHTKTLWQYNPCKKMLELLE